MLASRPACEEMVLDAVRALVAEVNPSCHATLTLDSDLERDLGLDSLARAELLIRIEEALRVRLPDALVAEAQRPRSFVDSALRAPSSSAARPSSAAVAEPRAAGAIAPAPGARTLLEALDWHASAHPDRTHVRLLSGDAAPAYELSYGSLRDRAGAVADGIARCDVAPGDKVALMLPTCLEYFVAFFGTLAAGAVPVPLYPPVRAAQFEDYIQRQVGILENAEVRALVTVSEARPLARAVRGRVAPLRTVTTVANLERPTRREARPPVRAGDTALLQYTSGSTGSPKGVVLTHSDLLENIRAMARAAAADANDVFVSWLPLYHDMGLIGAWLGSLVIGFPLVVMSPVAFLARPASWLRAMSDHRATLTGAPNFGYELCVRNVRDDEIRDVDLSSLRLAFNGAEPVSAETLERFQERFGAYGLAPNVQAPVYGLAEAAVGLAFPPPGRAPVVERIERQTLARSGRAVLAGPGEADVRRVVACGQPLAGYALRVVDAASNDVGERREGRIEFRGPSATSGYYRNEEATRALFDGDWLDTGDLGYLAAGEIFLTGRAKDLIIRAGRNLHPEELEEAIGALPGIRSGCVAAFASPDPRLGTEKLVVAAETHARDPTEMARVRESVVALAVDVVATPPDDVVLLPPRTLPKTSSGKIRRAAARERYEQGRLGLPSRRPRAEIVRLLFRGAFARARRARHAAGGIAYACYAWAVALILAAPVAVSTLVLPRRSWRFAVVRHAARLLAHAVRIPLSVTGEEHVPRGGPGVIVANHPSYIDGLVLISVLRRPVVFVVASEFRAKPWSSLFLRRLGVEFVERATPEQGAADTRRLIASARSGNLVVVFPEGRLSRVPGLRAFRLGAFLVATEVHAPLVPVAVRGTRSVVPPGHAFPRRGKIDVVIGAQMTPEQPGWAGAVALSRAARATVLAECAEPDIA